MQLDLEIRRSITGYSYGSRPVIEVVSKDRN